MIDLALILLKAGLLIPFAYGFVTLAWKRPSSIVIIIAALFCVEVIYDAFFHERLGPLFNIGPFAIFPWKNAS